MEELSEFSSSEVEDDSSEGTEDSDDSSDDSSGDDSGSDESDTEQTPSAQQQNGVKVSERRALRVATANWKRLTKGASLFGHFVQNAINCWFSCAKGFGCWIVSVLTG